MKSNITEEMINRTIQFIIEFVDMFLSIDNEKANDVINKAVTDYLNIIANNRLYYDTEKDKLLQIYSVDFMYDIIEYTDNNIQINVDSKITTCNNHRELSFKEFLKMSDETSKLFYSKEAYEFITKNIIRDDMELKYKEFIYRIWFGSEAIISIIELVSHVRDTDRDFTYDRECDFSIIAGCGFLWERIVNEGYSSKVYPTFTLDYRGCLELSNARISISI